MKILLITAIVISAGIAMYLIYDGGTDGEDHKAEKAESEPEPAHITTEPETPPAKTPEQIQQEYLASLNLGDGTLNIAKVENRFAYKRVKVYLFDEHYHLYGCKVFKKGTNYKKVEKVWLEDAIKRGFKPCPHCKRASHSMSRQ